MVAIASDLSNDFIVIALVCWWPHFLLVAFASTQDFLPSAKHLLVAASPSISLKLNAGSIEEPARSLATPLSRSDAVLGFVRLRQRFVRWSQAPRHGGSGLAPNSVIACT